MSEKLKDAKVTITTSEFLLLRDKLNRAIESHKGYDNSIMKAYGTSEVTLGIYELKTAFGELCELLHELIVNNAPTVDAVEVVRCKDCKKQHTEDCLMYHEEDYIDADGDWWIDELDYSSDEGYCHAGERSMSKNDIENSR